MNLFVNYFHHATRSKEIDQALKNNIDNARIKRIIILSNDPVPFTSDKIIEYPTKSIPTYQDFFDLTNEYPEEINIISNSDIYFDDSIVGFENLNQRFCYALTRHEHIHKRIIEFTAHNNCPVHYSQDVWAKRGAFHIQGCDKVLALNLKNNIHEHIPFNLGVPGCDNVIAHYLSRKYILKNPYRFIKAIHLHESRHRPDYKYRITGNKSKWGLMTRVPSSGL